MGKRVEPMSGIRVGGGKGGNGENTKRISDSVRVTIQSIRETTGKQHSDDDIFAVLEDCDMDANETAQRLLYIDTFHEVRRKPRKEETYGTPVRSVRNVRGNNFVPRRGNACKNGVYNNRSLIALHADSAAVKSSISVLPNGKSDVDSKPTSSSESKKHISSDENRSFANPTRPNRLYSSVIQPDNAKFKARDDSMSSSSARISAANDFSADFPQHGLVNYRETKPTAQDATLCSPMKSIPEKSEDSLLAVVKDAVTSQTSEVHRCLPNSDPSYEEDDVSSQNGQLLGRCCSSDSAEVSVKNGQVIFPNHLKVPENVKNGLVFGNFDVKVGEVNRCANVVVDTENAIEPSNEAVEMCEEDSIVVPDEVVYQNPSAASHIEASSQLDSVVTCLPDSHEENSSQSPKIHIEDKIPVIEITQNHGVLPHVQSKSVDSQPQENHSYSTASEVPLRVSTSQSPTEQINLSTPPPPVIFRPPFHPNFLLYGHYINPYIFPPVHMFLSHNGHPQQASSPTDHLTSAPNTAPGIKFPLPYQKAGPGVVNLSPSLLPIYGAYGSPPVGCTPNSTIPSGIPASNRDVLATQSTDNHVYTTTCQSEGSTWIPSTSQDLPNLQCNSSYQPPMQGQQLAFVSPVHAAPPPFPVCYQTCQTSPPVPHFPQTIPSQSGWQPSADYQMTQIAPTNGTN